MIGSITKDLEEPWQERTLLDLLVPEVKHICDIPTRRDIKIEKFWPTPPVVQENCLLWVCEEDRVVGGDDADFMRVTDHDVLRPNYQLTPPQEAAAIGLRSNTLGDFKYN
jgi:hypothetical protein